MELCIRKAARRRQERVGNKYTTIIRWQNIKECTVDNDDVIIT